MNLTAAETVSLKNTLEVAGRVRLEGFAGREAEVRLLAEADDGRMAQVAVTRVRSDGEVVEEPVRLEWTPTSVGERKLTLRIEPVEGEVVVANNELSTFVDVVDGGLRALYLEGALRVEQRFLRRALAASPDMQVDFQWIDSARRDRWPVDLARAFAGDYDVFLIGDLDAAALRPDDLKTLAAKVEAGAGIGFLGGIHSFEAGGWGSTPLAPLLPFEPDRLRMLPDPRVGSASIPRLGSDAADTRAAWEAMPPVDGANDLGRLVPAAKPLAVTPDGRPLLVAREFGAGRVLAFAVDSTWRWVMQGAADSHKRFWRQLVLWLAKQDEAAADTVWVRLAQRRLPPGAPLPFDVGITTPDGTLPAGVAFEASVISPSGQRRPARAVKRGETFSGLIVDCVEPGEWKLVVVGTRPGEAADKECSRRFNVFRQDVELANPRANPLLMKQLAEVTTGGVRLPEELPAVLEEIASRPPEFETREQWTATPWDTWPMLLLLAGCLCTEWTLRKRWGLV